MAIRFLKELIILIKLSSMASSVLSVLFGWRASPQNCNSVESRNRFSQKPAVQFSDSMHHQYPMRYGYNNDSMPEQLPDVDDIDDINFDVMRFEEVPSCYIVYVDEKPDDEDQIYIVLRPRVERSVYKKNINRLPFRNWDDAYPYKTIAFDVFRTYFDVRGFRLESLSGSLDGLVMFLGTNHSFALPAAHYPELKPDSIYFTDMEGFTPLDWQTYGDHDSGIYDCVNKTFSPLQYPQGYDVGSIQGTVQPPVWFTPKHN
ncbi:hypothetical protein OROMI_008483 [Orobanche minor]